MNRDHKKYAKEINAAEETEYFGRKCLIARRLIERDVRFVQIWSGNDNSFPRRNWDSHENIEKDHGSMGRSMDGPAAALIQALKQRGLLDDTLVVWGAEFGRTPLGENRGGRSANTGRDHHPFSFSIFMAGGGIRGGQVIGETDEVGWHAIKDRMHINDFHATLLHLFGFDHERLTYRFKGRDFRLTDVAGKVANKLIS